jgi:hypothetical protein
MRRCWVLVANILAYKQEQLIGKYLLINIQDEIFVRDLLIQILKHGPREANQLSWQRLLNETGSHIKYST